MEIGSDVKRLPKNLSALIAAWLPALRWTVRQFNTDVGVLPDGQIGRQGDAGDARTADWAKHLHGKGLRRVRKFNRLVTRDCWSETIACGISCKERECRQVVENHYDEVMSAGPKPIPFVTAAHSILLPLAACVVLAGCHQATKKAVEARIWFTQVPQWSTGDQEKKDVIEGMVRGARQGQRMVLYSKVGGLWWLQPLLSSPFTAILPNNEWRNEMHLGTDYAALLVDPSYHPAAVLRQLPERGGSVAEVAVARGQEKSSSFFVDFSGFTWRVRWKPSDRGGTSNPYNPSNVYTDRAGALHLQIVNRDQRWTCSEVNLTRSLGYGTYSFTVEDTSRLEPATVFGMFTFDYSTDEQNNREFDINISRWGDPDNKNAEYVLQPTIVPSNVSRFIAPAGKLKHTIIWEPGRVTMMTSPAFASPGTPAVSRHVFTSEVPTPGSELVRMAFYVYWNPKRKSSGLQRGAEIVVDRFQYSP